MKTHILQFLFICFTLFIAQACDKRYEQPQYPCYNNSTGTSEDPYYGDEDTNNDDTRYDDNDDSDDDDSYDDDDCDDDDDDNCDDDDGPGPHKIGNHAHISPKGAKGTKPAAATTRHN
jgi:hypothetical protein